MNGMKKPIWGYLKTCDHNNNMTCTDHVEIIVGGFDVKGILAGRLLPAAVTGAGGAAPAVVVEDGGIVVHVWLLTYNHNNKSDHLMGMKGWDGSDVISRGSLI